MMDNGARYYCVYCGHEVPEVTEDYVAQLRNRFVTEAGGKDLPTVRVYANYGSVICAECTKVIEVTCELMRD